MQHTPATATRTLIFGGSGFLGVGLAHHLVNAGHEVTIISRTPPRGSGPWRHHAWDGRIVGTWAEELEGANAIVNLSGRTVDCIKTPDHCDEILRSRVESTRAIGRACRAIDRPPPVWVQMSTAHIYGDPPSAVCDEDAPTGYGLAPDVGRAWEAALEAHRLAAQRCVVLRTSFVIGRANAGGAGALGKLGLLSRLGLGGAVGSGRQGMSWLHEADMYRMFEQAIANAAMTGIYNATSPNPVAQREFARTLRRHAGGLGAIGIGLPAPAPMVRLGAPLVLRTDPELALYGRYVIPSRLINDGFEFCFPTLDPALADLYSTPKAAAAGPKHAKPSA